MVCIRETTHLFRVGGGLTLVSAMWFMHCMLS